MPQLRLALAQVNPTVGRPRRQRRAGPGLVPRGRRGRRPRGRASRRWCSPATPSRTWRSARRSSPRRGPPSRTSRPGWPTRGSATSWWWSATSTRRSTSADRLGVPKGSPQNSAAVLHGGRVVARYAKHHLPNYGVFDEARYFVPGDTIEVVAGRRRRRRDRASARTSGRTAPRPPPRPPSAGLLLVLNGSPYEATRTTYGSSCARVARARPSARSPTSTWSAARTSWSSTATRSSSTPPASSSPAPPSSTEELLVVDLDLPAATPDMPADGDTSSEGLRVQRTVISADPVPAYDAADPRSSPTGSTTSASSTRRSWSGCATTSARTASPACCSACPAASTPPSSPRSPATRSAPRTSTASPTRASGPASTPAPTPPSQAERTGLHCDTVPIAPMVDAFQDGLKLDGLAAGEPAGPHPRGDLDGAVEPARPPRAGLRQQVRARRRLLHDLRRRGRRLRPDQGRPQDPGLGARPVAQRGGRAARRDPADPAEHDHQGAVAPSCVPASSTPTRCRRTRCSTTCSTPTSSATSAPPRLVEDGFDPALVEKVLRLVDQRRVQAPAVPARPEDLPAQLRPRPPPADHQPLARGDLPTGPDSVTTATGCICPTGLA